MLRLWRDLYRVVLHPQRVTVFRVRKARFSKVDPTEIDMEVDAHSVPVWRNAVDQLRHAVSGIPAGKADVEVVLSNHFARYAVIPWSDALSTPDESEVMVRIRFEELYGTLPEGWEVRLSEAGYGEPGIACAIDSDLMQELDSIFNRGGLRLISVQPFLMAAFNHIRAGMSEKDVLLLLNEPGRLGMVRINKQQWNSVRVVQVGNLQEELPGLLRREDLVNGIDWAGQYCKVSLDDLRNPQWLESKPEFLEQQAVMAGVQ